MFCNFYSALRWNLKAPIAGGAGPSGDKNAQEVSSAFLKKSAKKLLIYLNRADFTATGPDS
jgi:hypothetical protein